ncbi:MAG TPA: RodZ domain-containing protein [Nocardioidaceae bacterium]|nr:RodZ domain-containing protein [Nocardioidaceae bacterium]
MSIGQTLQAARGDAGMTIEQVSEATRIRSTIIRMIEQDDFTLCGGDFYARGHIRAIAHVVGADGEALVAEFDQGHADDAPRASEVFESEALATPERRSPSWSTAMIVVLVVVCIYGAIQLFGPSDQSGVVANGPTSTPVSAPTSAPPASSAPPATSAPPTSASSTPSVIAQVPRDSVSVTVDAVRGTSWVRATTASGKVLFEGLLAKGATRDFTDKSQVKLVIGSAGSIDLTVNGKGIGSPGKSGDVVHLAFGPDDPAAA